MEDEREGFRGALQDFVRAYSLIAQIVDWGDRDLERLYQAVGDRDARGHDADCRRQLGAGVQSVLDRDPA